MEITPQQPNLVIADLNGMLFAFCSPFCAGRYGAGLPPITVHTGASNGCWLCGRSLTKGSMEITPLIGG